MSSVIVAGDTSGSVTLQAPAVSGSTVLTLPTTTGTLVVNSGAQTIEFADGSASAPSITNSGDTNTGIFFPAADTIAFAEGGTESMRLDSSGNLGLGVTPSASSVRMLQGPASLVVSSQGDAINIASNAYFNSGWKYSAAASTAATNYVQTTSQHIWYNAPNGTAGNAITFTQAMTLDASGNLRVGTTGAIVASSEKLTVAVSGPTNAGVFANGGGATDSTVYIVNQSTSGNNLFTQFATEAGAGTVRGSITYNRAGGLTVYNTTSDYRAKIVKGAVENALGKVALLKPCTGRMNGASEDIDFFVAHELQEVIPSAVTGEKDAVKEDGTPDYQMVDKSAIIPLLTAAIQELKAMIDELKAKVAALEAA
jgi:hypothetical protein